MRNIVVIVILAILVGGVLMWHKQTQTNQNSPADTQPPSALDSMTLDQKMQLTDADWQKYLSKDQYDVLRHAGTEAPFTGALLHETRKGTFVTADCGEPVFRSEQKFESGTGWPSFWAPISEDAVELKEDNSYGMHRVEVVSKKCGSHLGHVFDDGPEPTGKRFCINSVALKFIPDPE